MLSLSLSLNEWTDNKTFTRVALFHAHCTCQNDKRAEKALFFSAFYCDDSIRRRFLSLSTWHDLTLTLTLNLTYRWVRHASSHRVPHLIGHSVGGRVAARPKAGGQGRRGNRRVGGVIRHRRLPQLLGWRRWGRRGRHWGGLQRGKEIIRRGLGVKLSGGQERHLRGRRWNGRDDGVHHGHLVVMVMMRCGHVVMVTVMVVEMVVRIRRPRGRGWRGRSGRRIHHSGGGRGGVHDLALLASLDDLSPAQKRRHTQWIPVSKQEVWKMVNCVLVFRWLKFNRRNDARRKKENFTINSKPKKNGKKILTTNEILLYSTKSGEELMAPSLTFLLLLLLLLLREISLYLFSSFSVEKNLELI